MIVELQVAHVITKPRQRGKRPAGPDRLDLGVIGHLGLIFNLSLHVPLASSARACASDSVRLLSGLVVAHRTSGSQAVSRRISPVESCMFCIQSSLWYEACGKVSTGVRWTLLAEQAACRIWTVNRN